MPAPLPLLPQPKSCFPPFDTHLRSKRLSPSVMAVTCIASDKLLYCHHLCLWDLSLQDWASKPRDMTHIYPLVIWLNFDLHRQERDGGWDRAPISCFSPPVWATAIAGQDLNQKPWTQPDIPGGWQESRYLAITLCLAVCTLAGIWIRSRTGA